MKILSYKFITPEGVLDISGMAPQLALTVLQCLEDVSLEYSIVEGKPITIKYLREYLFNVRKHFVNDDTTDFTVDTLVELIVEDTTKLPPFGGITLIAYFKNHEGKSEKVSEKHISVSSNCLSSKVAKRLTRDILDLTKYICDHIHTATLSSGLDDSMFIISQCSNVTKDLYSAIIKRHALKDPKFELSDRYYIEVEFL